MILASRIAAIALTLVLAAAPASAQHDSRAWTCELIADLAREAAEGIGSQSDGVLLVSTEFERISETNTSWMTFEGFLRSLSDSPMGRFPRITQSSQWSRELRHTPVGEMEAVWLAAREGGEADCLEDGGLQWASPEESRRHFDEWSARYSMRRRLPPNHPDYLPQRSLGPCGVGPWRFMQISRPVFDEYSTRATFIRDGQVLRYRRTGDGWRQVAASLPVWMC